MRTSGGGSSAHSTRISGLDERIGASAVVGCGGDVCGVEELSAWNGHPDRSARGPARVAGTFSPLPKPRAPFLFRRNSPERTRLEKALLFGAPNNPLSPQRGARSETTVTRRAVPRFGDLPADHRRQNRAEHWPTRKVHELLNWQMMVQFDGAPKRDPILAMRYQAPGKSQPIYRLW